MSNKLTGREAVKALMDGKRVFREAKWTSTDDSYRMELDIEANGQPCFWTTKSLYAQPFSLDLVLAHDDWEIVREPMVWEGVMEGRAGGLVTSNNEYLPDWMQNKRVKVRIEEVL